MRTVCGWWSRRLSVTRLRRPNSKNTTERIEVHHAWGGDSRGPKEHCIRWRSHFPSEIRCGLRQITLNSFVADRSTLSMLKRRRTNFHGAGHFTRYRYPIKFHHQPITNGPDFHRGILGNSHGASQTDNFLPACLRTTTRYGQEPTVQSSGQKRRVGRKESNKLQKMVDASCQCSLRVATTDTCNQAGSGVVELVSRSVSTGHQTYQHASAMTERVETVSRMTETDVRLVDVPEIDYITSKLTHSARIDELNSCWCTVVKAFPVSGAQVLRMHAKAQLPGIRSNY